MDSGSNSTVKTPEIEVETPTRMTPERAAPAPHSNGVVVVAKRHAHAPPPLIHNLSHHPVVVMYKECLKNHAASLGGHAVDGCGEFMPSPNANPAEPTSLKCAACGCHRNFHRREPELPSEIPALEYHPLHRHHPPLPPPPPLLPQGNSSGSPTDSPSPPPISSSYFPSAPHMLLALSHGLSAPAADSPTAVSAPGSRKRFRTKFTQFQKEKMLELAQKIGWKMQKRDDDLINESCGGIGIDEGVFKVWMHNNKNTLGKKDLRPPENTPPPIPAYQHDGGTKISTGEISHYHLHDIAGTNGSSSSS